MELKTKILMNNNKNLTYEEFISSDLIDVIYKMIKETYLGNEIINLDNPTKANSFELSDFLTYILAYPKNVDTPQVVVSNKHINHNNNYSKIIKNRNIVCFSGGVDSTGALLKLIDEKEQPIALWCNYGQPYKEPEKKAVEIITSKLNVPLIEVELDLTSLIEIGGEKFGHVFPARNLLIATIALCFQPKNIILAGLCDELVVPDKSLRMYNEFDKYFGIRLYSPFVTMTKTDVLCIWKSKWNKYLNANETVSCYSNQGNCQNCSSCAKREIAFVASGYSNKYPEVFTNQTELIETHWFSRVDIFQFERRTDMLIGLYKYKDKLSSNLRMLVELNYIKYFDEIKKRQDQLNKYFER